jgi:hypothetical protein
MIFEISFRVLSDIEIFLDDSAKFWEDFEKFWEDSEKFWKDSDNLIERIDDWDEISIWADISFSLFFLKNFLVGSFEIFLSNLNDILINFLDESLFLNEISSVVDLIDCDVLDVSAIAFTDESLNCS